MYNNDVIKYFLLLYFSSPTIYFSLLINRKSNITIFHCYQLIHDKREKNIINTERRE